MSGTLETQSGVALQTEGGQIIIVGASGRALGSVDDFVYRLATVLPKKWFADGAQVVAMLLQGLAQPFADIWTLLTFVRAQTRLATTNGAFLDIASTDFLAGFQRRLNETDAAFSLRIRREILRPRLTRAAIVQVLEDLTGNTPTVFRPSNAADTGGYGTGSIGYGVAGAWGSLSYPFQAFVTIKRGIAPGAAGSNNDQYGLAGYGSPLGGYGQGAIGYGDGSNAQGGVTDNAIYAAVQSVTPEGHVFWTQITGDAPLPVYGFVLPARFPVTLT